MAAVLVTAWATTLAGWPGPAQAGEELVGTDITRFEATDVAWVGTVSSASEECVVHRAARVFEKVKGERRIFIGRDHTNKKGNFKVPFPTGEPVPGEYRVKVPATQTCQLAWEAMLIEE